MRRITAKRVRNEHLPFLDSELATLQGLACAQTKCGLAMPEGLSLDGWMEVGETLHRIASHSAWLIGDWWIFGESRYGQRKAITEREGWAGPSFETCMNYGAVARRFETSRRRVVLSFAHHAELASMDDAAADALLDWAEETMASAGRPRSVQALRAEKAKRVSCRDMERSGGAPVIRANVRVLEAPRQTITATVRIVPAPCAEQKVTAFIRSAEESRQEQVVAVRRLPALRSEPGLVEHNAIAPTCAGEISPVLSSPCEMDSDCDDIQARAELLVAIRGVKGKARLSPQFRTVLDRVEGLLRTPSSDVEVDGG